MLSRGGISSGVISIFFSCLPEIDDSRESSSHSNNDVIVSGIYFWWTHFVAHVLFEKNKKWSSKNAEKMCRRCVLLKRGFTTKHGESRYESCIEEKFGRNEFATKTRENQGKGHDVNYLVRERWRQLPQLDWWPRVSICVKEWTEENYRERKRCLASLSPLLWSLLVSR